MPESAVSEPIEVAKEVHQSAPGQTPKKSTKAFNSFQIAQTQFDWFAGNKAGIAAAMDVLELIEDPQHVLRVGHDVGRRHVGDRADVLRNLAHPATANLLLLAGAQVVRITNDSALRATQRDIHHGTLPGHPHRERSYGINRLLRMEAYPTFARTARIVVLHTEASENLHRSIVHSYRDGKVELT